MISKFNKGFRFLLYVTDIYIKFAWFIPLRDRKRVIITNVFQIMLDESSQKPSKIWVDKGSEFYNRCYRNVLST